VVLIVLFWSQLHVRMHDVVCNMCYKINCIVRTYLVMTQKERERDTSIFAI
jgi:hypothetical protein